MSFDLKKMRADWHRSLLRQQQQQQQSLTPKASAAPAAAYAYPLPKQKEKKKKKKSDDSDVDSDSHEWIEKKMIENQKRREGKEEANKQEYEEADEIESTPPPSVTKEEEELAETPNNNKRRRKALPSDLKRQRLRHAIADWESKIKDSETIVLAASTKKRTFYGSETLALSSSSSSSVDYSVSDTAIRNRPTSAILTDKLWKRVYRGPPDWFLAWCVLLKEKKKDTTTINPLDCTSRLCMEWTDRCFRHPVLVVYHSLAVKIVKFIDEMERDLVKQHTNNPLFFIDPSFQAEQSRSRFTVYGHVSGHEHDGFDRSGYPLPIIGLIVHILTERGILWQDDMRHITERDSGNDLLSEMLARNRDIKRTYTATIDPFSWRLNRSLLAFALGTTPQKEEEEDEKDDKERETDVLYQYHQQCLQLLSKEFFPLGITQLRTLLLKRVEDQIQNTTRPLVPYSIISSRLPVPRNPFALTASSSSSSSTSSVSVGSGGELTITISLNDNNDSPDKHDSNLLLSNEDLESQLEWVDDD
jgi:hypothetical protein